MTDEEMEFEGLQMEALCGDGNKNSGLLVETKSGLTGRTFNTDDPVNGKVMVYSDKGKFLCDPSNIKVIGFID